MRVDAALAARLDVLRDQVLQPARGRAITGTSPACDNRFGLSKDARVFARPCNNRTYRVSFKPYWKLQKLPLSQFRGHLSYYFRRKSGEFTGGSRLSRSGVASNHVTACGC